MKYKKDYKSLITWQSSMLLFYIVLLFSMIPTTTAVKKSDFKTCQDASFCKRNLKYGEYKKQNNKDVFYNIVESSISFKDSVFRADILNIKDDILLDLNVSFIQNESIRIKVAEKNGIKKRYDDVKDHALVGEPRLLDSSKLNGEKEGKTYVIINGQNKVVINYSPIKLDFWYQDEKILSFNERDFFNFEHYRLKEAKPSESTTTESTTIESETNAGESENREQEEVQLGLWEETFNGHTDSKKDGPSSIGLDVTFHNFDHVYGIPQHATNLSLKTTNGKDKEYSEPYRLYNLDVFEYEIDNTMALYGSIPFMVAHRKGKSCGIFWLNSAEMWIDVEKEENKDKTKTTHTHWISESGLLDIFIFIKDEPKKILKQYGELTGFTALPPSFALGYHQCRWNYINQKDVEQVDAGFDKYDIPYDVLWLDIEHTDGKKYFTWDLSKFPKPDEMQNDLAKRGRKMVTIVDPHIKREDGYYVHKEATELGYFVKNPSGNDFDGWCWPGSSSWVDYTRKDACDWWINKFKFSEYKYSTENLYVWNDMNEPSVFNGPEITMQKDLLHANDVEHREVHNMFGMLFHRSTAYGLVKRLTPNRRPFVLSRAFFPGTQRFGAIWTGDNGATWDYLHVSTPMLLTIGLTGISFSGADVGGFFGNPEPELLVRWYQAGAFQPFFRGHAHIDTKRREPWLFGEPYTSQIRKAIQNRYQLLPYWYTQFFISSVDGTPAMRAMFLEFPEDEKVFGMDQQYMVGPSLLVKPVTSSSVEEIEVYLPGSENWYNYFTFEKYTPGTHTVPAPADTIPVFLRSGQVVTQRNRLRRAASLMLLDPITLLISIDSKGEANGTLYLDDGMTYDYLRQGYAYRDFSFKDNILYNTEVDTASYNVINPLPFEPELPKDKPTAGLKEFFSKVRVEKVIFLGVTKKPTKVVCLKCGRQVEFTYFDKEHKLIVKDPKLNAVEDWKLGLVYE